MPDEREHATVMTLAGLLIVWSALALSWWLIAAALVSRASAPASPPASGDRRRITVFKCLAGDLDDHEASALEPGLETFVAELDSASELLLGVHDSDEPRWRRWLQRMGERHPGAAVRLVADPAPDRLAANPKVSWMRILAPHATGELWLWSDADMEAPAGTLERLRTDFAAARADGAGMVTSPYVVLRIPAAPAMLDVAYVNLEHYPGALLLDRLDRIRFGFGAGMLFQASDFHRRVDWDALGERLADDFHLGAALAPVRLGTTRLTTSPASARWAGALSHYYRWRKTIRWCAPGGFAAQILVLPVLGWLAAVAADPARGWAWMGLGAVTAMDAVAAAGICRMLGCRVGWHHWHALPVWSVIRALTWIACWLPAPIVWRGATWWAPRRRELRRERGPDRRPARP